MKDASTIVRPASIKDAREIALMHINTWRTAYAGIVPDVYLDSLSVNAREVGWANMIERGVPNLYVADCSGKIAGVISFGSSREAEAVSTLGEVMAIYVAPEFWFRGVGRSLLLEACEWLRRNGFTNVMLWTLVDNTRACRFYEAAGFMAKPDKGRTIAIGGKSLKELYYEMAIGEKM